MSRRTRSVALAISLIVATTLGLALSDASPSSPWRHVYLVAVIIAGLGAGVGGGVGTAVAAALAFGPFVLREIEGRGATAAVVDGAVTFAVLALAGALVGSLATRARRQRERYETLLALQAAVVEPLPPPLLAARLAALLTRRLGMVDAGLVLDGGHLVAGGDAVHPDSPVAVAMAQGEPVFVPDAGTDTRVRRVLVVPLTTGGDTVGALALERHGDMLGEEREALVAFGTAAALVLDNARLAARQRRFTEELERKVSEATARLAEMDRLKSDFVAMASHELRTPLTALQGFSELLATRPFAPSEVQRLAVIMRAETERLGRMVGDFLDLARLERGLPPVLRRAVLDPAPVIAAAVELFRRTRTTHRLELHVDGALPHIDADADALDRVLKNLIANALKYSPPGTCVRVRARATHGTLAMDVDDEGPGIAPEERARVFEPYYRAESATRLGTGVGLGLAVVKSIVEAHGGSIHADVADGRGTRMTVTLPALS